MQLIAVCDAQNNIASDPFIIHGINSHFLHLAASES